MKIARDQLAAVLEAQGDPDAHDKVAGLPEEVDSERDADALAAIGLDQDTLRAKLAAGGVGGNLSM